MQFEGHQFILEFFYIANFALALLFMNFQEIKEYHCIREIETSIVKLISIFREKKTISHRQELKKTKKKHSDYIH